MERLVDIPGLLSKHLGAHAAVNKTDPHRPIDGEQWLKAVRSVLDSERVLGDAAEN